MPRDENFDIKIIIYGWKEENPLPNVILMTSRGARLRDARAVFPSGLPGQVVELKIPECS